MLDPAALAGIDLVVHPSHLDQQGADRQREVVSRLLRSPLAATGQQVQQTIDHAAPGASSVCPAKGICIRARWDCSDSIFVKSRGGAGQRANSAARWRSSSTAFW